MKLALDHRLAQGEEIHLGRGAEEREVSLPCELGSVRIFTRAKMGFPEPSKKVVETEIPLGTVACVDGIWVWAPSRSTGRSTLTNGNTVQVGRDSMDSDNQAISRIHFSLTPTPEGELVIQDEHSTNGTWVVKLER